MPGIVLKTRIEGDHLLRGLGKAAGRIVRENLKATAAYWHDELLAAHFTSQNRRFGVSDRTDVYKQIKRRKGTGKGKFVFDVLTGKSERFMAAFSTITGTQRQATLAMKPPGYFTNPYIGEWRDQLTGEHKQIVQQPDKPAEITAIDAQDRAKIEEFSAKDLEQRVAEENQRNANSSTTI